MEEVDEGQHNKSPNSKSDELKDNTEKPCRNTVVEYKMNGSEKWKKKGRLWAHSQNQVENIATGWI